MCQENAELPAARLTSPPQRGRQSRSLRSIAVAIRTPAELQRSIGAALACPYGVGQCVLWASWRGGRHHEVQPHAEREGAQVRGQRGAEPVCRRTAGQYLDRLQVGKERWAAAACIE